MTEHEIKIRQDMDLAAREDRERFFKVADTLNIQPKYVNRFEELEHIKQEWRDMTELLDYPNIDFPLALPDWFPKVNFVSCWEKNKFIEQELKNLKKQTEDN